MCSGPGFGASVSGSRTTERRRLAVKSQRLDGREALAQIASVAHTRYASALVVRSKYSCGFQMVET